MATVLWRPEPNALTTPRSWRPLHLPRSTSGNNDLAARIAQKHSALDEEVVKIVLKALVEEIKLDLINGNQVALEARSPSASPSTPGWTLRTRRCRRQRKC